MDSTTIIITKLHNWKDDKFDVESNALAMAATQLMKLSQQKQNHK